MREIFNIISTKEKRRELRKKQTETEEIMWKILRNRGCDGLKFKRQYGIGKYIADFYCPEKRIVVEIDGSQHFTPKGMAYDKVREEYMKSLGIRTIRFTNYEVKSNTEGVIEALKIFIHAK